VFLYRDEFENIKNGNHDPRFNWGGRRNNILSEGEEYEFLAGGKKKRLMVN
jgi:hypothetical protein